MYRPVIQPIKTSQIARAQRQVKQTLQKPKKAPSKIECAIKIQRWWRKVYLKSLKPLKNPLVFKFNVRKPYEPSQYHSDVYSSGKVPLDFEDSFAEKPLKNNRLPEDSLQSVNSSIQSKAAELLQYLDDSDIKIHKLPENSHSTYDSQAAILNYRLELEESLKTIDSLKLVIQRLRKEAQAKDEENKKSLEIAMEKQRNEYEEISLKNMNFIEQLLLEKQQRIQQLAELNTRIKENEGKHVKIVNELKEKFEKELKKQKDAWVTTENNKRNSWMKEKTKEIKETTTKGLEPEIMRILAENKRAIEKLRDEQNVEMRQYKLTMEQDYEVKISGFKEELKQKYDELLEREREGYQEKLRELHFKQEEEFLNMRKRWNEDLAAEKQKVQDLRTREESTHQTTIRDLQQQHSESTRDLIQKYQSQIEDLELKSENKLKRLKQELALEKEEWISSQLARLTKEFEERKESTKVDLVQNRDKEIKLVISKLSEEKISYKKKIDKECEVKLKLQQEKHETEIMEYEKLIEKLKEKIEKSSSARKNLDDNFQTLGKRIQDQEMMILKLEGEKLHLKDVITTLEVKIEDYKQGQGEVIEEVRKEEKRKQNQLTQEIEITKEQIELLKEKYEEKLAQIAQKESEEFEAIEARVKSTIMRKDEKIREIQQELQLSKIKISKLEELLEKQRRNLMQL